MVSSNVTLNAELEDERARDAAMSDDAALVRYVGGWTRRVVKLQQAHPARWHVHGLSPEEVRDALSLALLELLRSPGEVQARYRRAGREWGLSVILQALRELRKRFRVRTTVMDLGAEPLDVPLVERTPSHEERWLELETQARREFAQRSAEQRLSNPQRRWLHALRLAAEQSDFFRSSAALNLSAASRVLGKNRSSAQRAYRELQTRFQEELDRTQ
jgi:hypothetical protein